MSGSAAVPPWVPYGAKAMQEVAGLTNEVAMRLLCDKRMEQAWKDLGRLPEGSNLNERVARIPACFSPDAYGAQVDNLSTFDRLAAALFYQVMVEIYQPQRTYWTKGEAKKMARPFLDAAKLCQEAPSTDLTLRARVDLLAALELVEGYFRSQGEMRMMKNNPRVLGRRLPKVADEKRGHARMIATMIRDLFSPPANHFPHSAVTRFLVVSLGRDDDIDELKESVRDWCDDLPPERSSTA